jgi:hypothetical protein
MKKFPLEIGTSFFCFGSFSFPLSLILICLADPLRSRNQSLAFLGHCWYSMVPGEGRWRQPEKEGRQTAIEKKNKNGLGKTAN